jgi:PAS domain S-box-containing protein
VALDVKTLIFCNFLLGVFLVVLLLVYRARQRTYPGYVAWVIGTALQMLGLLSLVAREAVPLLPGVLVTNACFYFSMVFELEGALRFARGRPASRLWYGGAVPFLLVQGWLSVGRDEVVLRSLLVALYMAWVNLLIAWIFLAGEGRKNLLYRLFAAINLLSGAAILARAALWVTNPSHGLFDSPYFHTAYFSLTLVAGAGAAICYLLLTSQRLEQEVRAGEERFRRLVEASTMGILFLDAGKEEGLEITGANPAASTVLGMRAEELVGRTFEVAFPGATGRGLRHAYRHTARTGEPFHREGLEYHDDRVRGFFDVFAVKTGKDQVAVLFNDVSERKRLEAERLTLQAREHHVAMVENQGRLVQGLAHEIRNPLFALHTNTLAAIRAAKEGREGAPFAGFVEDQVRRLDALLRDLIELGRRPGAAEEDVDLSDLVRSAAASERESGARPATVVRVRAPEEPVRVRGDARILERAFAHLLENALDFTPEGEAVEVAVSVEEDRAKVKVCDRGPGIRPEIQGSLFEPFVTSRTGHTGLGLALARHYLRSHGADVEARNREPGPGAVVTVTLPLRGEPGRVVEASEKDWERSE